MALTEEQSLRQAVAREEANLAALEQKRQKSRGRLATLRAELAAIASPISIPSTPATQPSVDIPTTPKEKVSLFRKLFRGRSDVYPLLWINSKTGRKGYSPACGNEWVRGICEKPRVK
ncbi:MAG: restriction endonuclease subunit R, partial [Gammaproteobacteria bacterium]|nr:restriction endonuclease subunit R [Gammaproteobacteria bacterium]